jgi:ribonucleotide monophosphatase NagD (HAD superfamily)
MKIQDYLQYISEDKGKLETGMLRAMIDFDGTIHKYSKGYQDGTIYDEPFDGAKEFIDWLRSKGYQIVIFTTRASKTNDQETGGNHKKEIIKIENYLKEHEIHYDLITAEKLAANFYIDDRAIHFNNWKSVKDEVIKRMNL